MTWVGAGLRWKNDATGCPECGGRVVFGREALEAVGPRPRRAEPAVRSNRPTSGGCCRAVFPVRALDFWLDPGGPGGCAVLASGAAMLRLDLALPGRCNQANAVMALAGALALGGDGQRRHGRPWPGSARSAAGTPRSRPEHVRARLLLAKNPAGWAEVFDMLAPAPAPVVVAINARTADGHDPSWLWDVPFEQLAGPPRRGHGRTWP